MSDKKFTQREEALEIIKGGRSVMLKVNGQKKIFSAANIDQLPSAAEMAVGDPELSRMAAGDIDAEIERLQAAKKKLASAQKENKDEEAPKKASKSDEAAAPAAKEESK
jgi:hypothetical protein